MKRADELSILPSVGMIALGVALLLLARALRAGA